LTETSTHTLNWPKHYITGIGIHIHNWVNDIHPAKILYITETGDMSKHHTINHHRLKTHKSISKKLQENHHKYHTKEIRGLQEFPKPVSPGNH